MCNFHRNSQEKRRRIMNIISVKSLPVDTKRCFRYGGTSKIPYHILSYFHTKKTFGETLKIQKNLGDNFKWKNTRISGVNVKFCSFLKFLRFRGCSHRKDSKKCCRMSPWTLKTRRYSQERGIWSSLKYGTWRFYGRASVRVSTHGRPRSVKKMV